MGSADMRETEKKCVKMREMTYFQSGLRSLSRNLLFSIFGNDLKRFTSDSYLTWMELFFFWFSDQD